MRYTEENIQKILAKNEGFQDHTYYKARNKKEENFYTITGGKLQKRSVGRTSFGGSQYDETTICDLEQTRRFLKERTKVLNLEI